MANHEYCYEVLIVFFIWKPEIDFFFAVLEIELRASRLLGKCPTTGATPLSPFSCSLFFR
jgi:hypothetical protein